MDINKSDLANIYNLIKKFFLLGQHAVVYHDVKKQFFNNWIIIIQLEEYLIKIYCERGEIFMAFGPLDSNLGWHGGPWVDAEVLIAYITEFKLLIGKYQGDKKEVKKQIQRLSNFFRQFNEKINNLLANNGFQKHQDKFDLVYNQIVDIYIQDSLKN